MKKLLEQEYIWYHGAWEPTSDFDIFAIGEDSDGEEVYAVKYDGETLDNSLFVWCEQMDGYYYDDGSDCIIDALDECEDEFSAPNDWLVDEGYIWSEHEDIYLHDRIACVDECGEYATEDWYERNDYVEAICDQWDALVWTNDYVLTEDTDVYYTRDYADDSLYYRDECWYEEEPETSIYDYHAWDGGYEERSVGNEKLSRTGRKLFMGTELEVDDLSEEREEFASSMLDYLGRELFHAERDGSVDHEYISQPMTLEKRKSMEDAEREALQYARHYARSHDAGTCGLHVHVNEDFFDDHS